MTNELERVIKVKPEYYFNIPCWDGTGPTLEEFSNKLRLIVELKNEKKLPVVVHCAFGKGRSLSFLIAAMVILIWNFQIHKSIS